MTNTEACRRYRARHPERIKARNASANSRAARARYERSDKCVMYRATYAEDYEKKPERIAAKKIYRSTPKGRHTNAKASRNAELRKFGITQWQYSKMLHRQHG